MTDETTTLLIDSLPGLLVLGGFAFAMALAYLWSVSRKPTRFAGLRYRMIQDRIPQIALVILLLIGLFLAALAVKQPALLILIVPIAVAALVLTLVAFAAVTWIEGIVWHGHSSKKTSSPKVKDVTLQSAPLPQSAESNAH